MLRRILTMVAGIVAGVVVLAIAISNRQPVQLILDPFRPDAPLFSLQLPFYAYLFAALLSGVILGGTATWLGQSRWRRAARNHGRRARRFEAEAERLARERDAAAVSTKQLAIGTN